MKNRLFRVVLLALFPCTLFAENSREVISFNGDWLFKNQEDVKTNATSSREGGYAPLFKGWPTVSLPHTAKIELLKITDPWVGISWYTKAFTADPTWKGRCVNITFEGAMQEATVWLNHKRLLIHSGGYLPFTIDISKYLDFEDTNWLIVRTDNRDNAEIPPGKPNKNLDFCYYSGIYRNVFLTVTNQVHITDAIQEDIPASGGIRVWYPNVSTKSATVSAAVHVRNFGENAANIQIACKLLNAKGKVVASSLSGKAGLPALKDNLFTQELKVQNPALWHPEHPYLYTLEVRLLDGKKVIDLQKIKIGIRSFSLKNDRLQINGQPFLMCGTNRNQDYPYIGNALSDNAQYRDAFLIKKAGFNVVRLSHYPQADAFMNACDELGILTIAAIPGWQFFGDSVFVLNSYQNARELIRRDRNHPSVALWELSLNEPNTPDYFMVKMNEIAKEESPQNKLLTTNLINRFFDEWIPARKADGSIEGHPVVKDIATTATQLTLRADFSGKPLKADGADVIFIHATVCDANGHPVYNSEESVEFQLEGDGKLIGSNPIKTEAGIATILLQAGTKAGTLNLKATGSNLKTAQLSLKTKR